MDLGLKEKKEKKIDGYVYDGIAGEEKIGRTRRENFMLLLLFSFSCLDARKEGREKKKRVDCERKEPKQP